MGNDRQRPPRTGSTDRTPQQNSAPGGAGGRSFYEEQLRTARAGTKAPGGARGGKPREHTRPPVERPEDIRRRTEDLHRRAVDKKKRAKVIRGRILTFVIMFAAMLLVSVAVFFINLHHYERPAVRTYTYIVGTASKRGQSVPYRKVMRDGIMYVNLSPVLELCGIVTTGDAEELRFTIDSDANENVLFRVGTCEVYLNGVPERLTAPSVLDGTDLYVPFDFLATYVKGLNCTYNDSTHAITVKRAVQEGTTEYEAISFLLSGNQPMVNMDEEKNFGGTSALGLKTDPSAYESYINPADRDAYLTVASDASPLSSSYEPENLIQVANIKGDGRANQFMVETAEKASEALFAELRANNYKDVGITVGYVSYSIQNYYYKNRDDGEDIDKPGTNDHQLGLSFKVDRVSESVANFGSTNEGRWLAENAWKFGFILRFPADKTAQTGTASVSNQFRFVGRYHAMRMHDNGMCLEEYVAYLKEIGYLPADPEPTDPPTTDTTAG